MRLSSNGQASNHSNGFQRASLQFDEDDNNKIVCYKERQCKREQNSLVIMYAIDIMEELIRRLTNQALELKTPCEKTIRFCRQITKSHCLNAIRHIRCQKRAGQRENIDLESIVNSRDHKAASESASVVEYKDFVQTLLSYLPAEYQHVVELAILDFSRAEIACELCVSTKVLQRMFNEIGVTVNLIIKDTVTNGHPSPITQHPSPMKKRPASVDRCNGSTNLSDGILKKCRFYWTRRFKFLALVL